MNTMTVKAPIQTIRYSGNSSVSKQKFGQKYFIFTIKKEFIEDRAFLRKLPYKKGGFNHNLLVITGYCKDELLVSDNCEIVLDVDSVKYDTEHNIYTCTAIDIKKELTVSGIGLERYLLAKYKGSKGFRGIGAKMGEKISAYLLKKYPDAPDYKVLFEKEVLTKEQGIIDIMKVKVTENVSSVISGDKKKEKEILTEEEMIFCTKYDLPLSTVQKMKNKIIALSTRQNSQYKSHSVISHLTKEPYLIALDNQMKGYGFKKIDKLAKKIADEENALTFTEFKNKRFIGFLQYNLQKSLEQGHLFLDIDTIYNFYNEYNESEIDEKYLFELQDNNDELQEFIVSEIFKIDEAVNPFVFFQEKFFLKKSIEVEKDVAYYLKCINNNSVPFTPEVIAKNLDLVRPTEWKLSSEQEEAILKALLYPVSVITGGPGTGKTTISQMVINILNKMGKSFKIFAPTGTAAKRISSVVKEEATTIHRGLGFKGTFEFNENNPLKEEVIIVDESSMIDVFLARSLLKASINSQIIFIGDVNQLPSVGPGDYLRDIINSKMFNVSMLTQVFRQAAGNPIIQFAYKVNEGATVKDFFQWYTKKTDYLDYKCIIPFKKTFNKIIDGEENPDYLKNMINEIVKVGAQTYLTKIDELYEAQILVSSNRDNEYINAQLQSLLNENEFLEKSTFKIGDKIIQIKNNYKLNIFNGSIGVIKEYDKNSDELLIEYMEDKGTIKRIEKSIFEKENKLCYSMTIHKSQGQEFKRVLMLVNNFMLNNREMLYTGATRAKDHLILITNTQLLSSGINTTNKKGVLGKKDGKNARKTMLTLFLVDFSLDELKELNNNQKTSVRPVFD